MTDSIARRIKYARELRGISQGEVSRKTGISKGTISVLERDPDSNITIKNMVALCKVLQVSVEYIVFGSDSIEHNNEWKKLSNTREGEGLRQIVMNLHNDKRLEALMVELQKLSRHDQDIVFNLIKGMNESKS
jgi:transcriptional regulator with XRE-family HTH domain